MDPEGVHYWQSRLVDTGDSDPLVAVLYVDQGAVSLFGLITLLVNWASCTTDRHGGLRSARSVEAAILLLEGILSSTVSTLDGVAFGLEAIVVWVPPWFGVPRGSYFCVLKILSGWRS